MPSSDLKIPAEHASNLVNPAAYAGPRIHETYAWLRANQPLGIAEIEGFDPFWVVTRHADILEVSRQNALFLNGARSPTIVNKEIDQRVRQMMGGSPHLLRTLIHMDAPDHPKYRILTQAWFLPQNLRRMEERIRIIARAAVDRMLATGGRCDFVREVALHYPLHVVMDILGVPEEDEPRMLQLTQELFGASDPELRRKDEEQTDEANQLRRGVIADFYNYFAKLSAARKAEPRDDLASVIANSQIDGRPISEFEAMSYYIIVATAGHDTTSSSTAGALWALAERPAELAKVKADPSLIPGLVDESIRWTTPVKTFMRTVAEDVEFAGRQMRKDDWMMLCYASGNRDEAVFDDPQEFRVDRSPNKHLAFGYGAHVCLGQHLAKMEMRILWEELLPKIDQLELAGEPKMSEAAFVNGPKTLPVRFEAA
ncbi:cytochrome P450 [Phenylobacterium terrae]|uniref:Cytochrome P450 n=1 Tax=Phenylobacterium terrae TaxID=2665495 RepID=A0ABW4MY15_9CAUL